MSAENRRVRALSVLKKDESPGDSPGQGVSGPLRRHPAALLSSQTSLLLSRRRQHIDVSRPVYNQMAFDEGFIAGRRGGTPRRAVSTARLAVTRLFACSRERLVRFLLSFLPFIGYMRGYSIREDFVGDILAGITVGVTNVPQGMGYAILASLPPVYGLYVSFFPPIIYFLFGTSRHNSIGVFAVTSMMIASAIDTAMVPSVALLGTVPVGNASMYSSASPASTVPAIPSTYDWLLSAQSSSSTHENISSLATTLSTSAPDDFNVDVRQRVMLACSLSLLVGLMQIVMGVFRLGFVTIYLSDSLISGFTTGVAIHIMTSQIPALLGIKVDRFSGPLKLGYTYANIFSRITTIRVVEPVMGLIALVVLIAVKEGINEKFKKKMKMPVPIELILVVAATAASYYLRLNEDHRVKVVGMIPAGFTVPEVPEFRTFGRLLSSAFALAVVIFAVSVSLAKTFAKRNNYDVDANQELIAYGMTNALSSMFGCFPSCSSLSRSAIQENQGGKTQIASVVAAALILVVLLWMGPLLEALPACILAAIILVGLKGTFLQFNQLKPLWQVAKHDFAIWLVTFLAVVVIDVDLGLVVGVAFGLLTVVFRSQTAYACLLERIPHTDLYKDKSVYKTVEELPGVRVFRMDAPLHYVNVEHFRHKLYKLTGVHPQQLQAARNKVKRRAEREQMTARAAVETEGDTQGGVACCYKSAGHGVLRLECLKTCYRSNRKAMEDLESGKSCLAEAGDVQVSLNNDPIPLEKRPDWPKCSVQFIIVDCSTMSYVDLAGINVLKALYDDYKSVGIGLLFANCKAGVRQMFVRSGLYEKISRSSVYVTIHDAVLGALQLLNDEEQRGRYEEDIIAGSTPHIAVFSDPKPEELHVERAITEASMEQSLLDTESTDVNVKAENDVDQQRLKPPLDASAREQQQEQQEQGENPVVVVSLSDDLA